MTSKSLYDVVSTVADAIHARAHREPELCIVLGSGLGAVVDTFDEPLVIPYAEIPGFPVSSVHGHAGNLVFGKVDGKDVVAMQGRVHFYESGDMAQVTMPTRIMRRLGAQTYFVTNSAGGVHTDFAAGDLMLIRDHINLMGTSPLIGLNDKRFGPRFPDMSHAYEPALRAIVHGCAQELGISLKEGVYAGFFGPAYETPAEVRMAKILGADAVGMSTVPEVVVANHMGMQCVGISCISNLAAGISATSLSHDEVMDTAKQVSETFVRLVRASIARILA